jgi:hypothetical protein
MRRLTFFCFLLVLTSSPVHASCSQRDLAGTWFLEIKSNSLISAFTTCTVKIYANGFFDTNFTCTEHIGGQADNAFKLSGRLRINNSNDCIYTGDFIVEYANGYREDASVYKSVMDQDKSTLNLLVKLNPGAASWTATRYELTRIR